MKKIFVSDFNVTEVPTGGAEWVDDIIIKKFNFEFQSTRDIKHFDLNNFYFFSNISLLNPKLQKIIPNLNYCIIEHDYKICQNRSPWMYENNIVPLNERINYEYYKNAKAVFVQTTDHMEVFKKNEVDANFVNFECSIWSEDDINLLENLLNNKRKSNNKYAVYYSGNWIKNTQGNLKYCSENKLPIFILKPNEREIFLRNMSTCEGLVFFPLARETFCRLVVEAKCLGLNVITSKNYGASLENWFDELSEKELIVFLKNKTEENINKIKNYLL
jgi:hypothetical protein